MNVTRTRPLVVLGIGLCCPLLHSGAVGYIKTFDDILKRGRFVRRIKAALEALQRIPDEVTASRSLFVEMSIGLPENPAYSLSLSYMFLCMDVHGW